MKRYIIGLALTSFLFILFSCGGGVDLGPGGSVSAPVGATITIFPSEVSVKDTSAPAVWHRTTFTITVTDKNGIPLNDVEIWISYQWAVPDSTGLVQLYDGGTPKNSPMSAVTDGNGVYQLRFEYQSGGGLEYTADLEVRSGSISGSATFSVSSS